MKIVFYEDSKFVIYLNHSYAQELNFNDKEKLEEYFKELFYKLNKFYHIPIEGYYDIHVYLDSSYGAILELTKEDLDFFEHQIDMRIILHEVDFLYELQEYKWWNPKQYQTIWYHNKWYVKPIKDVNTIDIGKLLESSEIQYHEENEWIIKRGKVIQPEI